MKPKKKQESFTQLTLPQVAEMFGVTDQCVAHWIKAGLPYIVRPTKHLGGQWIFSLKEVIEWKMARDSKKSESSKKNKKANNTEEMDYKQMYEVAKMREMVARANKAEIDVLKAQENLISTEQAKKVWSDFIARIRSKILVLPSNAASVLKGASSSEIKSYLSTEIESILDELSTTQS